MSQENNDGFTSGGRKEGRFPNTYLDYQQVGEYALEDVWPTPVIERFISDYREFEQRDDVMPRAREMSRLILLHLVFEVDARAGIYGSYPEIVDGTSE